MISVELNTAIKSHFLILGYPYNNIKFIPLSAYSTTEPPFIIFNEFLGTHSDEQFFLKTSNIVYSIYDNDISSINDISWELDKFLNVGDYVGGIKTLLSTPYYGTSSDLDLRYRITMCRKVSGMTTSPTERYGFNSISMNFRVVYIDMGEVLDPPLPQVGDIPNPRIIDGGTA